MTFTINDKRFTLGDKVEKVNLTANLESGVLTVTAPKVEVETGDLKREKVRKIPITCISYMILIWTDETANIMCVWSFMLVQDDDAIVTPLQI